MKGLILSRSEVGLTVNTDLQYEVIHHPAASKYEREEVSIRTWPCLMAFIIECASGSE